MERFAQWLQAGLLRKASRDDAFLARVEFVSQPDQFERQQELVSAVVEALCSIDVPAVMPQLPRRDPLASARLRGFDMKRSMFASGEVLTSGDVARRIGVSPARVQQMCEEKLLLGLPHPSHEGYLGFPTWQFEEPVQSSLPHALTALGECDAWDAWLFLTTSDGALRGFSPLEVLRERPDHDQDTVRLRDLLREESSVALVESAARRFIEGIS